MHLEPNIAASREANGLALWAPSFHAGMPLKAHRLEALRGVAARIETGARRRSPSFLSLGIAGLHDHLSGPGLAWGVLHEIAAAGYEDRPAASFGFTFSLMAAATQQRARVRPSSLPHGARFEASASPIAMASGSWVLTR